MPHNSPCASACLRLLPSGSRACLARQRSVRGRGRARCTSKRNQLSGARRTAKAPASAKTDAHSQACVSASVRGPASLSTGCVHSGERQTVRREAQRRTHTHALANEEPGHLQRHGQPGGSNTVRSFVRVLRTRSKTGVGAFRVRPQSLVALACSVRSCSARSAARCAPPVCLLSACAGAMASVQAKADEPAAAPALEAERLQEDDEFEEFDAEGACVRACVCLRAACSADRAGARVRVDRARGGAQGGAAVGG